MSLRAVRPILYRAGYIPSDAPLPHLPPPQQWFALLYIIYIFHSPKDWPPPQRQSRVDDFPAGVAIKNEFGRSDRADIYTVLTAAPCQTPAHPDPLSPTSTRNRVNVYFIELAVLGISRISPEYWRPTGSLYILYSHRSRCGPKPAFLRLSHSYIIYIRRKSFRFRPNCILSVFNII